MTRDFSKICSIYARINKKRLLTLIEKKKKNLRMRNKLHFRNPKTVRYGTETISFLSPKIWSLILQNIYSGFLTCFKKNIRKWKPTAHVVYAKHFCNMLVLFSSTVVLPPQFFSFFSLFEVHVTCSFTYYILSVRTIVNNLFRNLF